VNTRVAMILMKVYCMTVGSDPSRVLFGRTNWDSVEAGDTVTPI